MVSPQTRTTTVRKVFMARIILAPNENHSGAPRRRHRDRGGRGHVRAPGGGLRAREDPHAAADRGAGVAGARGDEAPVPRGRRRALRRRVTRDGVVRIARFACELALRRKLRGRAGKITCVTKSNVLPQTDGLFHQAVEETVRTYPKLAFEHFHVDDAARRIVRFPTTLDVVVCMNQYGDILSDVAGEVAGGLGVAPSANFGDNGWAYFESVHGSAPDIAGRGIANPTGTLLSAALMLEYLGLSSEAARLETAVARVYRDGKTLTPDQRGTATTTRMADAVLAAYRNQ